MFELLVPSHQGCTLTNLPELANRGSSQAKLPNLANRGHSQAMMPKWATRGHLWTDKYKLATRERTLAKFTKSALPCQAAQVCQQEADSCFNNDFILLIMQKTLDASG